MRGEGEGGIQRRPSVSRFDLEVRSRGSISRFDLDPLSNRREHGAAMRGQPRPHLYVHVHAHARVCMRALRTYVHACIYMQVRTQLRKRTLLAWPMDSSSDETATVHMYVGMYVCMYVCMCACMYVCVHLCTDVCMHAQVHACVHMCMGMYACACRLHLNPHTLRHG